MVKIPDHAQQVFSGEIFTIYQRDQEMFDGSVATFEAGVRPSTVIIVPVVWDTIAIARERQPGKDRYITMMAGRIDAGEESLAAAKRELEEEWGMVSTDWELFTKVSVWGKLDYHLYYYIARDCQVHGNQNLDAGGEEIEVQYVDFDGFVAFVQSEACKDAEFANMIFRLEKEGRLEEFRQTLFGSI